MKNLLSYLKSFEDFLSNYENTATFITNLMVALITGAISLLGVCIALYSVRKTINFEKEKQKEQSSKILDLINMETESVRRSLNMANLEYVMSYEDGEEVYIDDKPFFYSSLKEHETLYKLKEYVDLIKNLKSKNLDVISQEDVQRINTDLRKVDALDRLIRVYIDYYNEENQNPFIKHLREESDEKIKSHRKKIEEYLEFITRSF